MLMPKSIDISRYGDARDKKYAPGYLCARATGSSRGVGEEVKNV